MLKLFHFISSVGWSKTSWQLCCGTSTSWPFPTVNSDRTGGLRTGTYFQGTKLPLKVILWFMYAWAHEMSSIAWCAWDIYHGLASLKTAQTVCCRAYPFPIRGGGWYFQGGPPCNFFCFFLRCSPKPKTSVKMVKNP